MAKKKVFFASPFSAEFRWIWEATASACRQLELELRAADETTLSGDTITDVIYREIAGCDLGVAVISGLNANVMYELGLLHQSSKPTVVLSDPDTFARAPFDIRSRMQNLRSWSDLCNCLNRLTSRLNRSPVAGLDRQSGAER